MGSCQAKQSVEVISADASKQIQQMIVELADEMNKHTKQRIRWTQNEWIGEGTFAKVFKWQNLDTEEEIVAKRYKLSTELRKFRNQYEHIKTEIKVLSVLNHPNIVRLLQVDSSDSEIIVILEFVKGGTLNEMIKAKKQLPEGDARHYTMQMLLWLDYMHRNGVIHRDLKSANILIHEETMAKLADFGSSKRVEHHEYSKSFVGSPYFMAPEIVKREGHSYAADIWSLGWLVIEMLSGRPPWSDMTSATQKVFDLITTEGLIPNIPECSLYWKTFVLQWLQRDQFVRPTPLSLLTHPFIIGTEEHESDSD